MDVMYVGGPRVEAVEDMRRVDDGGAPRLSLALEPKEEVLPNDHVERGRDLVEEQDVEGPQEAEEELDASPLAIRDLVHPPLEVDAQEVKQHVAPLGVLPLKLRHHPGNLDVRLQRAA